jgi:hypothetical protein
MNLHVVDHCPHAWFLLGDQDRRGEDYYLDVNCDLGAVGFSMLVKLSEAEREEMHRVGRAFVDQLATQISDSPSSYRERNLTASMGAEVHGAVMAFLKDRPDVNR